MTFYVSFVTATSEPPIVCDSPAHPTCLIHELLNVAATSEPPIVGLYVIRLHTLHAQIMRKHDLLSVKAPYFIVDLLPYIAQHCYHPYRLVESWIPM